MVISHELSRLARSVQWILAVLLVASGCVLPPPLDVVVDDAGLNSAPIIKSGTYDTGGSTPLRPPATITVDRLNPGNIRLVLYDTDAADQLYVQMFNDYDLQNAQDADVNCNAPPGAAERQVTCPIEGLCTLEDVGADIVHRLEIEVYDRDPDPNFPFRSFTTEDADGLFSTLTVDLICIGGET
jgi:hypothetical protein